MSTIGISVQELAPSPPSLAASEGAGLHCPASKTLTSFILYSIETRGEDGVSVISGALGRSTFQMYESVEMPSGAFWNSRIEYATASLVAWSGYLETKQYHALGPREEGGGSCVSKQMPCEAERKGATRAATEGKPQADLHRARNQKTGQKPGQSLYVP